MIAAPVGQRFTRGAYRHHASPKHHHREVFKRLWSPTFHSSSHFSPYSSSKLSGKDPNHEMKRHLDEQHRRPEELDQRFNNQSEAAILGGLPKRPPRSHGGPRILRWPQITAAPVSSTAAPESMAAPGFHGGSKPLFLSTARGSTEAPDVHSEPRSSTAAASPNSHNGPRLHSGLSPQRPNECQFRNCNDKAPSHLTQLLFLPTLASTLVG